MDTKISIYQLQDRAKLLWSYNKELIEKIEKKELSHGKVSEVDESKIRTAVYGINNLNEKIEKKTKDHK